MNSPADDALLARLALHYKLATEEQLQAARDRQAAAGGGRPLGDLLVELGILHPKRLEQLEAARAEVVRRQGPATTAEPAAAQTPSAPPTPSAAAGARPSPIPQSAPAPLPALDSTPSRPALEAMTPLAAAPSARPVAPPAPAQRTGSPQTAETPRASGDSPRNAARLDRLLEFALRQGASDIHVHSGASIRFRRHGEMIETEGLAIDPAMAERAIREILLPEHQEVLDRGGQVDFAYDAPGLGRFRANAYRQTRGIDAVFRAIPGKPPTLSELGLPSSLARLADFHQGLVLVTGPAGCGKSATLAALVHLINGSRRDHIITIEDPIEILHPSLSCVVNQRQVGIHTESFSRALHAALREDPDVIAIGELRDLETIALAITAAETGHLVLATLHTSSAIRTVNRLLGVFPPNQQDQIRTMLSESLRAVISQRLVARADGAGRVAALEVLIATRAVGNLIRDNKTFQLKSVLQTGTTHGMCLLDASLADLIKAGTITREEALKHAEDPAKFQAPGSAGAPSGPQGA